MGHGKIAQGHGQDRYAVLLAKVRRDYLSQATLSTRLTAKHGRHVVSSTLAMLIPSLSTNQSEVPEWAAASLRPLAYAELPNGDSRLLAGQTTTAYVDENTKLSLV